MTEDSATMRANYAGPKMGKHTAEMAPDAIKPEHELIVKKAIDIATKAHEFQTRWSGEPYINHPKRVAAKFHKSAWDLRAIAWLHDTPEDTSVTTRDIAKEFSKLDVSHMLWEHIVEALEYLNHRKDLGESYIDYLLRIRENELAVAVKLADIENNLGDLSDGSLREKYLMAQHILKQPDRET